MPMGSRGTTFCGKHTYVAHVQCPKGPKEAEGQEYHCPYNKIIMSEIVSEDSDWHP